LKNNLLLLAEQFSIEAADARILQASLWDNPVLSAEFNVLNPQNNSVFDIGSEGQKAVAIQQLFYLGGRKNNEVELAANNAAAIIAEQQRLQTLLSTTSEILPTPPQTEIETYQQSFSLGVDSLQSFALRNRPDIALATNSIRAAEVNLSLQQSIAVPDITLGASYDKRGGAFLNQVNITLAVALPVWNRNQGNINIATAELSRAKTLNSRQTLEVRNQVLSAYHKYQEAVQNIRSIRPTTEQNWFNMILVGKQLLKMVKVPFCHTDAARYLYRKVWFYTLLMDADLRPSMTNFSN
jgi:outer membrane protein TolC